MDVTLETTSTGIRFRVKVVPGSSQTVLAGTIAGMLKIKVAAPPEKGRANQCLTDYLSRLLGIRKNQVKILSGTSSPIKQLQIEGVALENIRKILDIHDA
jgi:uncharacterized protein (TIGR00251 family)